MDSDFGLQSLLSFLERLARDNNREWFNNHRKEYEAAIKSRNDFTAALIAAIASVDPDAACLDIRDCTYRIFRDVRFSSDKSPYKTHIGIFINPPAGKKSILSGYYFHLQPGNSFVCAGNIGWPGKVLAAVRLAIYDNIDEYRSIVESTSFRKCYPHLGDSPVKTAPKGFSRHWPYIDYIRPRNFLAESVHDDVIFTAPALMERMMPYIREAKRFNDFLNFTVEDFITTPER